MVHLDDKGPKVLPDTRRKVKAGHRQSHPGTLKSLWQKLRNSPNNGNESQRLGKHPKGVREGEYHAVDTLVEFVRKNDSAADQEVQSIEDLRSCEDDVVFEPLPYPCDNRHDYDIGAQHANRGRQVEDPEGPACLAEEHEGVLGLGHGGDVDEHKKQEWPEDFFSGESLVGLD